MTTVLFGRSLDAALDRLNSSEKGHFLDFWRKLVSDPSHPSLSLERLTRSRDAKIWAGRVTQSVRAILHRDGDVFTLLYAGRHDDAYAWAERRRLERHEVTGALQLVETPERVEEQIAAQAVPEGARPLFAAFADEYLLGLGLPLDWLAPLRELRSRDLFLETMSRLPEDVYERLFDLMEGVPVTPPPPLPAERPATESADTRRSFVELDEDGLRRLLAAPLATWITFLHPSQERLVGSSFGGPVKVTGAAGTGKTVVAMHRARGLARQGKRVLLTTFVGALAENTDRNLRLLCSPDELRLITVGTVHSQALQLLNRAGTRVRPANDNEVRDLLDRSRIRTACPFPTKALLAEWEAVISPQGVASWDEYRAANRAGRGRALAAVERRQLWNVFERVLAELQQRGRQDWSGLCRLARELLESGRAVSPYDAVIVDEVQDLQQQELRLTAALAGSGADRLMLVGDAGQRIYYGPYSMRALGIDVRGRSHVLRINYRTSEEIRRFADGLLGERGDDLDGGVEARRGCLSLFNGPEPRLHGFRSQGEQAEFIALETLRCLDEGLTPDEIAVFARSTARANAVRTALMQRGIPVRRLAREDGEVPAVAVTNMHRAKGLEFKAVFVADASDDAIPSQGVLEEAADSRDAEDRLLRERQLLYVSFTRARDRLHVCWSGRPSRFLANVAEPPGETRSGHSR